MIWLKTADGVWFLIDAADAAYVAQFKWYARNGYIARRSYVHGKRLTFLLHRELLGLARGDGWKVDHKNHNGFDNRRCNIRACTQSHNMKNYPKPRNNTSGFKGVTLHKGAVWRARIKLNGRKLHLGLFPTAELAYAAYCAASPVVHGEYGCVK